jgi:hypothetical protein
MDRQVLRQHLVQAEARVASGEAHLARQKRVVDELTADGHPVAASSARGLLAVLEESQLLHVADRDRLANELGSKELRLGMEA